MPCSVIPRLVDQHLCRATRCRATSCLHKAAAIVHRATLRHRPAGPYEAWVAEWMETQALVGDALNCGELVYFLAHQGGRPASVISATRQLIGGASRRNCYAASADHHRAARQLNTKTAQPQRGADQNMARTASADTPPSAARSPAPETGVIPGTAGSPTPALGCHSRRAGRP